MQEMWQFYWPAVARIPHCLMKTAHGVHGFLFIVAILATLFGLGWQEEASLRWGSVLFVLVLLSTFLVSIYENHRTLLQARAQPSDAEDIKALIGSWTVRKTIRSEPTYLAVWDFAEDGIVTVSTQDYTQKGRWHLEPTRAVIQWDIPLPSGEQCYDTLHRPVAGTGTKGDSWGGWEGLNRVHATKTRPAV